MKPGNLRPEQAERVRAIIDEHARDRLPEEYAKGRWQSAMARLLGPDIVSQQTLSAFTMEGSKKSMSVGMAQAILRRLGEDPTLVLEEGAAQDVGDMSPARARVLSRVRDLFPLEVLEEVRSLPTDVRGTWSEIDWLGELMAAHGRYVRRHPTEDPPQSSTRAG